MIYVLKIVLFYILKRDVPQEKGAIQDYYHDMNETQDQEISTSSDT